MRVFVSWSGEASHDVAKALKDWLPNVIQAVDVFLSSEDIGKGSQWFQELGAVLEESDFGILCLTRENLTAPWMLYEAGAISKRLDQSRVTPLLVGLTVKDLSGPLEHFNAALLDRGEMIKLVTAINDQLKDNKLGEVQLQKVFDTWWPSLEPALTQAAAKAVAIPKKAYVYDVFLSAPMAAYPTDDEYKNARTEIKKIFRALKDDCGFKVYWAGENIESIADFDSLDVSVLNDLDAIENSRYFALLYPQRLVTSALFEAGYALALGLFSHYFVRDHADLPFLMREIAGPESNVRIHTSQDWKNYDDLARKIKKHKDYWFPH